MNPLDKLVRKCAELSGRIYSPLGFSEEGCGFAEVASAKEIHDKETDTTCVVCEDEGYIYVVFEGTDSATDVGTDLRFRQKEAFSNFNLHRGFYKAWHSISDQLTTEILQRLSFSNGFGLQKKLVFTGHSLGGALAHIAAAGTSYPTHSLITFGQPETGGAKFAEEVERQGIRHIRVVNHRDPIPHLLRWNPRYRHGGSLLYLDGDYNVHWNPSNWFMWKDRAFRMYDVSDHDINEYEGKLDAVGTL